MGLSRATSPRPGQAGPGAERLHHAGRHEQRRREPVGEPFGAPAGGPAGRFGMLRRHRVPCQDVEQFVREVEMPATGKLAARNQHRVEVGQAAGCAGNARLRIDHEHQNVQLPLHDPGQARRRRPAQPELFREPLPSPRDIPGRCVGGERQRAAQQRARTPGLRGKMAVGPDPAPGPALIGLQALRVRTVLAPRKASLAGKQEGIGEIIEGDAQLFDRDQHLVGRHASGASLDGGDGLPILETEDASEIGLRELPRFPQRANSLSETWLHRVASNAKISCIL